MATIEHSVLTSSDLHEPKGVASASSNEVYVADGTGSGAWLTAYTAGTEDFQDTQGAQSLGVGYANRTFLSNDGLGSLSTNANRLPGKSAIYDTSSDEFDFDGGGYVIGDQITIRVDFTAVTSGANHEIILGMDLAIGTAAAYTFRPYRQNFKTAATYSNVISYFHFDIGNDFTQDNPAKLFAYSDNSGDTVDLNGFRIFVIPKNVVWA